MEYYVIHLLNFPQLEKKCLGECDRQNSSDKQSFLTLGNSNNYEPPYLEHVTTRFEDMNYQH